MSETRAFFERLTATSRYEPRLVAVHGSVRFDVNDVGSWRLTVDDGSVTTAESNGEADCVVTLDEGDFLRLVRGQQNAITAFMQERLSIRGSPALALALFRLLPSASPAAQRT